MIIFSHDDRRDWWMVGGRGMLGGMGEGWSVDKTWTKGMNARFLVSIFVYVWRSNDVTQEQQEQQQQQQQQRPRTQCNNAWSVMYFWRERVIDWLLGAQVGGWVVH